jgi:general transcription factor 3C polypeptide 3 (transcription factor C subunit 4)
MQIYDELRGLPQEVLYNNGRLLHQLSMYSGAVYFYNRVLKETSPIKIAKTVEATGEVRIETADHYDLKRFAAHNLALIYENNGNRALARTILETYCKI